MQNDNNDKIDDITDDNCDVNKDNSDDISNYDLSNLLKNVSLIWFERKEVAEDMDDDDTNINKKICNNHSNGNDKKKKNNDSINNNIHNKVKAKALTCFCISHFHSTIQSRIQMGIVIPGVIRDIIKINEINCIVYWCDKEEYISLFNVESLECYSTDLLYNGSLFDTINKIEEKKNVFENKMNHDTFKVNKTLDIYNALPLTAPYSKSFSNTFIGSFCHVFNTSSSESLASIPSYTTGTFIFSFNIC